MESELEDLKETLKVSLLTSFYKQEDQITQVKWQTQKSNHIVKARISVSGSMKSWFLGSWTPTLYILQ